MIVATHVSKYYGPHAAVRDLDFEIEEGECVGFLGLNGAGKSTTLKLLSCLLLPTAGSIKIDGLDAETDPHRIRKKIGYLPDKPPVYDEMTVRQFLRFAAQIRNLKHDKLASRIDDVVKTCDLVDVVDQPIATLSHGYRQRVGIAQAIIHEPALLILDEPFAGLDPVQVVEMRKMIQSLRGKHTILLSTHLLNEVEQTCDNVLFLRGGEIKAKRAAGDISNERISRVAVAFSSKESAEKARTMLEKRDDVTSVAVRSGTQAAVQAGEFELEVETKEDMRHALAKLLIGADLPLIKLQKVDTDLESAFLEASATSLAPPKKGAE